ncbi:MAG: hypothetical protein H0T73_17595, partial [Ardenticatenales bacterium]|nr:hypothetical protein [Ardenticatenales bacterium]
MGDLSGSTHIPFMVEPLEVEWFVERPMEYQTLRASLLGHKPSEAVAITTALRGAGGYGKTTLARALAHDPEVRAAFPDGILWVTLGENPVDLRLPMQQLIQALMPMESAQTFPKSGAGGQRGIPPEVLSGLRATLLRCGPETHQELKDLFVDARLARWKDHIPTRDNREALVQALVSWLHEEENAAGENALLLFIEVLVDSIPEGQRRKQELQQQASELSQALGSQGGRSSASVPFFTDLNEATTALENALGNKRLLLVIDDVWEPGHLTPFLKGGANCARLITTRNSDTLPRGVQAVHVDAMRDEEAVELLGKELPKGYDADLKRLAARLGKWPLLLQLVNKFLYDHVTELPIRMMDKVLIAANKALTEQGLDAFNNPDDPIERNRAAGATIRVSLLWLKEEEKERYGRIVVNERRCYHSLAIFPEDTDIPVETLMHLWGLEWTTVDLVCLRFSKRSLVSTYNMEEIRLHDVVRTFLVEEQGAGLPTHHSNFLATYRVEQWADLPQNEPYLWQHLAYHLHEAGQRETLRALLLDHRWLQAKLKTEGFNALLADYGWLKDDEATPVVQAALELAAHVLAHDPSQLAAQLWGRLMTVEAFPEIRHLLEQIHQENYWLRPLTPSLLQVGSPLRRTFTDHTQLIRAVAMTPDGQRAISADEDNKVKVWDIEGRTVLRTLEGPEEAVVAVAISPDGKHAVLAGPRRLQAWALEGDPKGKPFECEARINSVAITPDGLTVIAAGEDHQFQFQLYLWSLEDEPLEGEPLKGHGDRINALAMSCDGHYLVSGSDDGTLVVWNWENREPMVTLPEEETDPLPVISVAIYNREAALYVVAAFGPPPGTNVSNKEQKARLWNLKNGVAEIVLEQAEVVVKSVAITDDGQCIIGASTDGVLVIWESATGTLKERLAGYTDSIISLAVDTQALLSSSSSNDLKLWDLELRTPQAVDMQPLDQHLSRIAQIAVTPNGRFAVSASQDGTVKVWEIEGLNIKPLPQRWIPPDKIRNIAIAAHDDYVLISASVRLPDPNPSERWVGKMVRWDLENNTPLEDVGPDGEDEIAALLVTHTGYAVWVAGTKVRGLYPVENQLGPSLVHNEVSNMAVTCNDQLVISASHDGSLNIGMLQTGERLTTLGGHKCPIYSLAITPDGRYVVSASRDNTLKGWNLENGSLEFSERHGHTTSITAIAMSTGQIPNGFGDDAGVIELQMVVSGSADGIKVWQVAGEETARLEQLYSLVGCTKRIYALAVVLGRYVIAAADDETLRVWDLAKPVEGIWARQGSFPIFFGTHKALAPVPRRGLILKWKKPHCLQIAGVRSKRSRIFLRRRLEKSLPKALSAYKKDIVGTVKEFNGPEGSIRSVAVTPDGQFVVSGSRDGTVRVWNFETGKSEAMSHGHKSSVKAVSVTPDGRYAISASDDKTLIVWDIENKEAIRTLEGHGAAVNAVSITADGQYAISASKDKMLIVWNWRSGEHTLSLRGHERAVNAVVMAPDGTSLFSASNDTSVIQWDWKQGEIVRRYASHKARINKIALSPDETWAVTASDDKTLIVWDLQARTYDYSLKGHTAPVTSLAITPDGKSILSASDDGTLWIWDCATRKG